MTGNSDVLIVPVNETPNADGTYSIGRFVNSGYSQAGASHISRALRGFNAQSGAPNEDIDYNNQTLRERSRQLYMRSPVASSAIKTNRTNVIGEGLMLQPRIDREILGISQEEAMKWQRKTSMEFSLWADNKSACDITCVNDFYSMQQLALMMWLLSGDAFCLFQMTEPTIYQPYSLKLHLIEADRIRTPSKTQIVHLQGYTDGKADNGNQIFDGVEVDKNGRIEAYYISNTYRSSENVKNVLNTKFVRIPAFGEKTGLPNILHIMDSERPDQYRGVPFLAPVIEALLMIDRYTKSEITAAVVQAFYTAFITTETPDDDAFNDAQGLGEGPVERTKDEYELGPGTVNYLKEGEDVKFSDPTRPNSVFDSFVNAMIKQVGAALEMPSEVIMKCFNSSYSASRGALLEAWKAFKMRRKWFASDFCQPVYNRWLDEAVAIGRIKAPGYFSDPIIRKAWQGALWQGPTQGLLDPVKEIKAEVMACEEGFSTREQSTAKLNGGNWNDNINILEEENKLLNKAFKPLEEE